MCNGILHCISIYVIVRCFIIKCGNNSPIVSIDLLVHVSGDDVQWGNNSHIIELVHLNHVVDVAIKCGNNSPLFNIILDVIVVIFVTVWCVDFQFNIINDLQVMYQLLYLRM